MNALQPAATQVFQHDQNSIFLKVLTVCVPGGGPLIGLYAQSMINNDLARTNQPREAVPLIELKNEYKILSAVNAVLTAALMIAGVAAGLIAMVSGIIGAVVCIGAAGIHLYRVWENKKVIEELNTTGFRLGMYIH